MNPDFLNRSKAALAVVESQKLEGVAEVVKDARELFHLMLTTKNDLESAGRILKARIRDTPQSPFRDSLTLIETLLEYRIAWIRKELGEPEHLIVWSGPEYSPRVSIDAIEPPKGDIISPIVRTS